MTGYLFPLFEGDFGLCAGGYIYFIILVALFLK